MATTISVPWCVAVLLLAFTFARAEIEVPGTLIDIIPKPSPSSRLFLADDEDINIEDSPSCSEKYGPLCGDCNTLWTCMGQDKPLKAQNCEETYPGRPFCENNACSATVSDNSTCASLLQCTGQGYFPNPIDCTQYYLCAGPSAESLVYQCPANYVYNPTTTRCRRRTGDENSSSSNCAQIDCVLNENKYAPYPANQQLYAFCLQDLGVLKPIMLRCPGRYHRFSADDQRCTFVCPGEGRFEDYADPEGYYECVPSDESATGYAYEQLKCLPGFLFQRLTQQCQWDASQFETNQTFYNV